MGPDVVPDDGLSAVERQISMRSAFFVVLATFMIVLGMVAAILVVSGRPDLPPPPLPAAPVAPAGNAPMEFTAEGANADIVRAIEKVVRPGRALVASISRDGARWICILVDADQRYYELDLGLQPEIFPSLRESGFAPPPDPISRTMSIYRSVAKRPMNYQESRGDKIIILLCPRDDWPGLSLCWPQ